MSDDHGPVCADGCPDGMTASDVHRDSPRAHNPMTGAAGAQASLLPAVDVPEWDPEPVTVD